MNYTSKKDLKKHISRMCDEVAQYIIPAAVNAKVFSISEAEDALNKLSDLQNATNAQLSVHFDKKPKDFANPHEYRLARTAFFKGVYDKAHEDFHKGIDEILENLNKEK